MAGICIGWQMEYGRGSGKKGESEVPGGEKGMKES